MFRSDKLCSASGQIAQTTTAFLDGDAILLHEPVGKILKAGSTVQHRRNLFPQDVLYGFKLLLPGLLSGYGDVYKRQSYALYSYEAI